MCEEIGLKLNVSKTKIINIENGKLVEARIQLGSETVKTISATETIKYLGVNFNDELKFSEEQLIKRLEEKIQHLITYPFLKEEQKNEVLNTYIWPILIYPLQTAPIHCLTKTFLEDLDKIIRSAFKELFSLPSDLNSHMLYSSHNVKGLQLFRASWEAYIQHINICRALDRAKSPYIQHTRDLAGEVKKSLGKLGLGTEKEEDLQLPSRKIREHLRNVEFEAWTKLQMKGRGVILFQDYKPANNLFSGRTGLTPSELKEAIKIIGDVAPVRAIPGRSKDGTQCRHCSCTEKFDRETLPHVLGFCPFGELLRNHRHHLVRTTIADALRAKGKFDVYEEVNCVADSGSTRRVDILAIDRKKCLAYILDPTIRFEISKEQTNEVDLEKKKIYEPTASFFQKEYNVGRVEVVGLLFGARGTITSKCLEIFKNLGLPFIKINRV